jgi:hypothetical protein
MVLAFLIARVKILWHLAQFPDIREGTILPLSEISGFNAFTSKKSI